MKLLSSSPSENAREERNSYLRESVADACLLSTSWKPLARPLNVNPVLRTQFAMEATSWAQPEGTGDRVPLPRPSRPASTSMAVRALFLVMITILKGPVRRATKGSSAACARRATPATLATSATSALSPSLISSFSLLF